VRVEILVEEGTPVTVSAVHYELDGPIGAKDDRAILHAEKQTLAVGQILEEPKLDDAEHKLQRALADNGYAKARVVARASVDVVTHNAVVDFVVHPGEKCVIGALRIVGLGKLPEHAVRREIGLDPGELYSRTKLDEAQQRLLDRGVVTSANISPDLDNAPYGVAPLVAQLQPAHLREFHFGGGFEVDVLKTEAHLRAGWADRDFFGDLRRFTVDITPGVVLYPTRLSYIAAPTALLPEEKLRVELVQPGFIERHTDGFIRPEFNTYPVIIEDTYIPGEPVLGYLEAKITQGVSRKFFGNIVHATLSHSVQVEVPFAYSGALDPSLTTLLISYVELNTTFDFRDNSIHPTRGFYISNDLQLAGLGGQPQDIRWQPELRGYVPLGKRVTLAVQTSVGFLFPNNYAVGTDTRDVQIVFFRGFFSGGPTENRGYPLRGIGPQGDVALYNPLINQCLGSAAPQQCAVPLGGLSLWEASVETRVKIAGPFSGVVFCDAADVSADRLTLHLDRPHLSCGLGARYDTPVGPIRADVGYRIPGAQVFSGQQEYVPDIISGVPIAISIGLGEAF
jgi:outer membrane translocation and assembly module TamA